MVGAGLAFASSLAGGTSDFLAGTASRRIGAIRLMFCMQIIGTVLAGGWVAVSGEPIPSLAAAAAGVAAGAGLMVCLVALFQAMVVGTMSIVAPISASGVAIPIVAGLVTGDRLSGVEGTGIVAALVGTALASHSPARRVSVGRGQMERGVGLALVAALGGGVFLWLMAPASRGGVPWAVLITRFVPVVTLGLVMCVQRVSLRPVVAPESLRMLIATSVFAFSGIVLYSVATQHGQLALVSVCASLYPVVTVLLAYRLLGERIGRAQTVGVAAILAGLVMMSAG